MEKVLTTRPRVGGNPRAQKDFRRKSTPREKRQVPFQKVKDDFQPKKESMTKPHRVRYSGKEFSDHISPLKRYLRKQAGRPWNKVWSEICAVMKGHGTAAQHVKDHVKGYVGGIAHSGQPTSRNMQEAESWIPMYVDKHGLLRVNKEYKGW